nr:hypothetical protein [uncultured Marinobacter sp.]
MGFNLRCGLIFLISVLPALANAANEIVQVKDQDAPLFQDINEGLSSLMDAAGECRSTDANLYECLCAESTALQKLDSALRAALERKPEWKGEVIYYDGATLQIPSLEKQVEDVQKQCGV